MSILATLFGLFWLVWLLWTLFGHGLHGSVRACSWSRRRPRANGGLANAIAGSVILTVAGVAIGAPAGILAGTYLAEYRPGLAPRCGRSGSSTTSCVGAPSIIIGVFVYALIVLRTGHFSGWAGAVALALIIMPVVVRTTENMMRLVPDTLREAAAALGAPKLEDRGRRSSIAARCPAS